MGLLYTSIRVRDLKASIDFYVKHFGMKIVGRRSWVPGEKIVMLLSKDSGQHLNLIWFSKSCMHYKPYESGDELDHLMFEVKDARKLYEELVANGAPVAMELHEDEDVAIGFVKDPDGIWIGLRSENKK